MYVRIQQKQKIRSRIEPSRQNIRTSLLFVAFSLSLSVTKANQWPSSVSQCIYVLNERCRIRHAYACGVCYSCVLLLFHFNFIFRCAHFFRIFLLLILIWIFLLQPIGMNQLQSSWQSSTQQTLPSTAINRTIRYTLIFLVCHPFSSFALHVFTDVYVYA